MLTFLCYNLEPLAQVHVRITSQSHYQPATTLGISGGISFGISGGISSGISSGISCGIGFGISFDKL